MTDQENSGPRFVRWNAIATDYFASLERGEKPIVHHTGFPLEVGPGMLTLIGGGPGAGKTTLALQIVTNALRANEELTALFASVEVPGEELLRRQTAAEADIPYRALREGEPLTVEESQRLRAWREVVTNGLGSRMALLDRPHDMLNVGACLDALESDLVVLDYIQRIPTERGEKVEPRLAINAVLDRARAWCDLGHSVIAISSLSRPGAKGGYADASVTSFRESGELEYGCDEAYLMTRTDAGLALKQVKARHREPIDIPLMQADTLKITTGAHDFGGFNG